MATRINQKWAVAVVYVSALFMSIMDSTIVNVALPALGGEFGVESTAANGVVVYYLVALAAAMPVSGWLGDRLGGRRVLLGAILLFVTASALCGVSTGLRQLEAARVLQAVAGGLMTPVGMAMLWRVFPPHERAHASAILVIPTAAAPALGPLLGGLFVTHLSWRWVFWVNVPIGVAAFLFGLAHLEEQRLDEAGDFDAVGFLLVAAGLGGLMYGVSRGPFDGWGRPAVLAAVVTGAALLLAMVAVELRRASPLLKLRLLGRRLFGVCNAVMLLGGMAFVGTLYVASLFFQDGLGLSAQAAGTLLFPEAVGVMVGSQLVAKVLYPRFGPRRVLAGGLALEAVMMLLLLRITPQTGLWAVRANVFMLGVAMSSVFISVQTAAFASTSGRDMGAATTLLGTQQQLGGAIGVAVMTTVMVAAGPTATSALVGPFAGYRLAFVAAAGCALAAALVALFLRDADAASTMRRTPDEAPQPAA